MSDVLPRDCAARFAPVRLLGTGGFGSVWLATQLELRRPVAVKVLHDSLAGSDVICRRFEAEARVTATLSHPHIVRVLDFGAAHQIPWIAYEYLGGTTLAARLQEQGALDWRTALQIATQIASALSAAHEAGVLHRDIQPANAIESAPGHWKVTDFGIAKWSGGDVHTAAGVIVGTPLYMPPERTAGQPATALSDQYALGIVLFEMLTGSLPFGLPHTRMPPARGDRQRPPAPSTRVPGLPPGLDAVVLRMLEPLPAARYADCRAVREALAGVMQPRTPGRGRAPLAAVALTALVMFGGYRALAPRAPLPVPPAPASVSLPPDVPPRVAALAPRAEIAPVFVAHTAELAPESLRRALHEVQRVHAAAASDLAAAERLDADLCRAAGTPEVEALRAHVRVRSYRCVFWRRTVLASRTIATLEEALRGRRDSVFDIMANSMELGKPADFPDGLALAAQYFEVLSAFTERWPATPCGATHLTDLLDDHRRVAAELSTVPFTPRSLAALQARAAALQRGAAGPAAAVGVRRLLALVWELGMARAAARTRALLAMCAEELRLLEPQWPAPEVAALRRRFEVEARR